ncbi:hypothetical protein LOK49_LG03G01670 [Camellia lanceoleosa]|uniref:Uncharacterized protein n=1 Tax=Camellia lanceoleosa TaxID=1840588 RepID=A0ACC0IG99_9ERIC|nr:hypothetical protein LOK49_LG03G01670 [Camellia lanceoleosa]
MSCRSRLVSSINMEMRGMEKTFSKMKKASGFEDAYLHRIWWEGLGLRYESTFQSRFWVATLQLDLDTHLKSAFEF